MKFLGRGILDFSGRSCTGAQVSTGLENCKAQIKAAVIDEENPNLATCVTSTFGFTWCWGLQSHGSEISNGQSQCWRCGGLELVAWRSHPFPHQAALVPAWADSLGSENSSPPPQNSPMVHVLPHLPTEGFVKLFWGGRCWTAKTKGSFRTSCLLKCHGIAWETIVKRQYTARFPAAVGTGWAARQKAEQLQKSWKVSSFLSYP